MKIKVGDKEFDVIVAETQEEQMRGLQDVEEMESDEGMIFIYESEQPLDF